MHATKKRRGALQVRRYAGPSPRALMTAETLGKLVRNGFGLGRGDEYQPWIRVRRASTSPVGTQHIFHLHCHKRGVHLLSGLEHKAAALAAYLGAIEVREQFPFHPSPNVHPGFDPAFRLSTRHSDKKIPTLLEVAEETGIRPGVYPGTDLPFVLTTDLLLTVRSGTDLKLVYWPIKPYKQLEGAGSARRIERLALEQRWAQHAQAHFQLVSDQTVSPEFSRNLLGHKPWRDDVAELQATDEILMFAEAFNACSGAVLADAWKQAASVIKLPASITARRAFDVALWLGHLDVNLSAPLEPHLPVRWGGALQRKKLREVLFGGEA